MAALCLMAAVCVSPQPARADPLATEAGQRALNEERFEDAWRILQPLATAPKAAPDVRFWAAEAAAKLQLWREALACLSGLQADLVAVADEIYARKARWHTALGAYDEALAAWHEVLNHHPAPSLAHEARFALGPLWLARGNAVAAVVAYKNAIAQAPKDSRADEARLRVAGLLQAQGNIKGAKAELLHLVSTARDPVAEEAAAALKNLQAQSPDGPQPSDEAGAAPAWQTATSVRDAQRLLGQRKADAAIALMRKLHATARRAERPALALMLGNMLAQQGRTDEAVQVLDRLAQTLPPGQKKQDALFRAAYLTYDSKNYGAAKKRFARFVGTNPRAKAADEALWFMGWCGFHLKQYEAALVDFGRLRRLYPQSSMVPRAEYWSARILALRHRDKEAQSLWQKLSLRPGYYGMLARQRQEGGHSSVPSGEGMRPSTTLSLLGSKGAPAQGSAAPQELSQGSDPLLLSQLPDEEMLGFVLAQGTQVLDWSGPAGARVSTLISLGLKDEAAVWVNAVRGLPGVPARAQALGRGQILYALGNYTLAMRQVTPILPSEVHPDPDPAEEMALRLAYPPAFVPWVMEAAAAFDVSELLLLALMRQESAFNARASSQVSAKGLMQIMPATGRRIAQKLGLKDYTDAQLLAPKLNIYLAGWYMRALLQRFGGNLPVAIGSYNAGPHASERWIQAAQDSPTDVFVEDIPYRETRDYIKKVLANLEMYGRLYGAQLQPWPQTVRVSLPGGVDF